MFQQELKPFSVSSLYLATFLYFTQGHRGLPLCTSSTVNIRLSAIPSRKRKLGDKFDNKRMNSRVCTKCFLLFLQLKAATNPVLPSGLRKWGIALPAEQCRELDKYIPEILFLGGCTSSGECHLSLMQPSFPFPRRTGHDSFWSQPLTFLVLLQWVCCWLDSSDSTNILL